MLFQSLHCRIVLSAPLSNSAFPADETVTPLDFAVIVLLIVNRVSETERCNSSPNFGHCHQSDQSSKQITGIPFSLCC